MASIFHTFWALSHFFPISMSLTASAASLRPCFFKLWGLLYIADMS